MRPLTRYQQKILDYWALKLRVQNEVTEKETHILRDEIDGIPASGNGIAKLIQLIRKTKVTIVVHL